MPTKRTFIDDLVNPRLPTGRFLPKRAKVSRGQYLKRKSPGVYEARIALKHKLGFRKNDTVYVIIADTAGRAKAAKVALKRASDFGAMPATIVWFGSPIDRDNTKILKLMNDRPSRKMARFLSTQVSVRQPVNEDGIVAYMDYGVKHIKI